MRTTYHHSCQSGRLLLSCAVFLLFGLCSTGLAQEVKAGKTDGEKQLLRVYFVGASHTRGNLVPKIVQELAASAPAAQPRLLVEWSQHPGHMDAQWNFGVDKASTYKDEPIPTPRNRIENATWDVIVFDDWCGVGLQASIQDIDRKWIPQWTDYIRSKKARPILFGTPPALVDPYPENFHRWNDFIVEQGKKSGAGVASAPQAWFNYLGQNPTLEQRKLLYSSDGIHLTDKGAYILACCLYSAITGFTTVGLTNSTSTARGISKEDAQAIQQASWKAHQETLLALKPAK